MNSVNKNLLLINPWIYDFTAYDLWSKPLGLLYLASFLQKSGFKINFIDCLDKYWSNNPPKLKKYGIGKFHREEVFKPEIIENIPRKFARYGIPENVFRKKLEQIDSPDAILITSIMTYWYLGPKRVVEIVREIFPNTPVILGGIYASLLPDHAKKVVQPDYIISGPAEHKTLNLLCEIFNLSIGSFDLPNLLDEFPYPAFELINNPDYLLVLTARGCPYNCSFCVQKQISMPFTQRRPKKVIEEILFHYEKFKLRDFAFYDDALFVNKERHIKLILNDVIQSRIPVRFHSPNGLFAKFIDEELAGLMYQSNFKTIRLSFETSNEDRQKDMSNKISNKSMIEAVDTLVKAGYQHNELEAYVIMGLPDQSLEEIISSILFINKLGLQVRLASYSPIHGTTDFNRAVASGLISADIDPLLTNKSIFPLYNNKEGYETFRKIRIFCQVLNDAAKKGFTPFHDQKIGPVIKSIIKEIN